MKLFLFIFVPLLAIAGLNGKEVYGYSTPDTKVEKYQRHHENPLGKSQSKKKTLDLTKKKLSDLKKEIRKKKIERTQFRTKKKVDGILEKEKKRKKSKKMSYRKLQK